MQIYVIILNIYIYLIQYVLIFITGCVPCMVVQHCYNGDVRFLWEILEL